MSMNNASLMYIEATGIMTYPIIYNIPTCLYHLNEYSYILYITYIIQIIASAAFM